MSEVENHAPATATKGGMKETATKPKMTSERKKLQTLQPNAKNQALLVRIFFSSNQNCWYYSDDISYLSRSFTIEWLEVNECAQVPSDS